MASHNLFGQQAEQLVVKHLQQQQFVILEQNYKQRFGEIDIIAQKDKTLVFVEVKARKAPMTSMFEIVQPTKQRKIIKTAQQYIVSHEISETICRFDVALIKQSAQHNIELTYVENAFYSQGY